MSSASRVAAFAAGQEVVAGPTADRVVAGGAVECDLEIAGRQICHRDAFQHDTIAVALRDGSAQLWSIDGRKLDQLPQSGVLTNAEFSRDGRSVVTTSKDGTAHVWFFRKKM